MIYGETGPFLVFEEMLFYVSEKFKFVQIKKSGDVLSFLN
jgi:hypothetical protein